MSLNNALRTFSYLVTDKIHSVYNTSSTTTMSNARRPNERVFIDSVISTASMTTELSDSEHSCSSASETDSEFVGDSSDSVESIEIEGH